MKVLLPVIKDVMPTINLFYDGNYAISDYAREQHILRLCGFWETGLIKYCNFSFMNKIDSYEIKLLFKTLGL
jgi:hypothetical protein